jgi:enoyl-CoA hydratase/carnithine racemase
MTAPVGVEHANGVGVVTLHSPPANALDEGLVAALDDAVAALGADDAVAVVLIRSELPVFAVGADLGSVERWMREEAMEPFAAYLRRINAAFDRLEALSQPVLCALNGHALGGGFELALACDLRLAADSPAIKLGLPEARLGLLPAAGGTQRLGRLVGRARAFDLLIPGRTLTPGEAREAGLLHRLVPPDALDAESRAEAERLARGPRAAYAAIKRCLVRGLDGELAVGQALERDAAHALFRSADAREGVRAFRQKRSPVFGAGEGRG